MKFFRVMNEIELGVLICLYYSSSLLLSPIGEGERSLYIITLVVKESLCLLLIVLILHGIRTEFVQMFNS